MSDPSGLESALDWDPTADAAESSTAFPSTARALLDRLGSLHGVEEELEPAARVLEPLAAVPLETSTSLQDGMETAARLTLGFPARPEDPDGRFGLVTALSGLASERIAVTVDEVLAGVATRAKRPLVRGLALRSRKGEDVRARPAVRVGGTTPTERSARIDAAMLQVGLDAAAEVHRRVAAALTANPFNAAGPYGLAFDLDAERVLGAKTYFACEWADSAVTSLRGRLTDELGLHGVEAFELLAAPVVGRRGRWLMELSFELPRDPEASVRAKAYLLSPGLAASEAEGHAAVVRLASAMGLDATPYQELVAAVRPDGLSLERPCSLMVGVSASLRGPSLEVYLFNPARWGSVVR